jgi:Na+/H+ antiporter NhaD/arsenite permease-like protein
LVEPLPDQDFTQSLRTPFANPNGQRYQCARMTFDLAIVLILMVLCFTCMVWEKVSVDVVAMCGMGALILTGVLTPTEAFSVFSNDAAITVASMFVLSAALVRTGSLEGVSRWFDKIAGGSEARLLLMVLPVTALLSAFVNNTPVVVMFMPILMAQAAKYRLNKPPCCCPCPMPPSSAACAP